MSEIKFYRCNVCGNLDYEVFSGGGKRVCCNQDMEELEPNTVDAAQEKHVPVIKRDGNKVEVVVGSTEHPMEKDHWIQMIALTHRGVTQVKTLEPGDEPKATFYVCCDEGELVAHEFCNLHGLWKAEA